MDKVKYRIISIEASDIMDNTNKNGQDIGVKIPNYEENTKEYKMLFGNFLDWSLDSEFLQTVYQSVIGYGFSVNNGGTEYTTAIVNVKFNYRYTKEKESIDTKQLREIIYSDGFKINGKDYVRYKRSTGSSRQGKCLFIRKELIDEMNKWGDCGLEYKGKNLASWEAYRSLSLSSIKNKIKIPLDSILFLKDRDSKFTDRVISVECEDSNESVKSVKCEEKEVKIKNKIWDGESLIDESLFVREFSEKHMLLLRNKFFKSCAFKTKLQQWFIDNNITDIDTLTKNGGVTLAKNVSDIKFVTTESSLKFLKFMDNELNYDNIKYWTEHVDDEFGIVKYDKRTKFFNGRMVQTSYQFLNTIHLKEDDVLDLIRDNMGLLYNLKHREEVLRYFFTDIVKKEDEVDFDYYDEDEFEDNEESLSSLALRSELIFDLLSLNHKFSETELYYTFRKAVITAVRDRFKSGKLLLHGTNAVLFGNGPELLLETIGKFDGKTSVLKSGEIRCFAFKDGENLVCARSPHITMGNLYLVKNKIEGEIWKYFDLGEQVVCVNAINENVMQRLNGCDYDSDSMLITNDELLYNKVKENYNKFLIPCCGIDNEDSEEKPLNELDHLTSVNQIGRIVNLSQRLNSYIWDRINKGSTFEEMDEVYKDVCILAVLSGVEIDKAKRTFPINAGKEIDRISLKYKQELQKKPNFFVNVDTSSKYEKDEIDKTKSKEEQNEQKKLIKQKNEEKLKEKYTFYETAMDYIFKNVPLESNFRKGKGKYQNKIKISSLFTNMVPLPTNDEKAQIDFIVQRLLDYKKAINNYYTLIRSTKKGDEDRDVIYADIDNEMRDRDEFASEHITNIIVLKGVISEFENNKSSDWHIYASFMKTSNKLVEKLFEKGREKLTKLYEVEDGDLEICKFKYTIK